MAARNGTSDRDHATLLIEALEVLLALTNCAVDGDHNAADRFIRVPKSALRDAHQAAMAIREEAGL